MWPRVPSFICFTVAHIAFELVLYRHKRAWKPALWSRVGTQRHGVIGVAAPLTTPMIAVIPPVLAGGLLFFFLFTCGNAILRY